MSAGERPVRELLPGVNLWEAVSGANLFNQMLNPDGGGDIRGVWGTAQDKAAETCMLLQRDVQQCWETFPG